MGAYHYFMRYEYAWRTTIHVHGVAWLPEPDEGIGNLSQSAL
jgi:hypothetical protein